MNSIIYLFKYLFIYLLNVCLSALRWERALVLYLSHLSGSLIIGSAGFVRSACSMYIYCVCWDGFKLFNHVAHTMWDGTWFCLFQMNLAVVTWFHFVSDVLCFIRILFCSYNNWISIYILLSLSIDVNDV